MIRIFLAVVLVALTAIAAKLWAADYSREPDPAARMEIEGAMITKDKVKAYYWVDVHLKKSGGEEHDLRKPVRLVTGDGVEHVPADTTFAGSPENGFTDLWFKFWLEEADLHGTMVLKINDGTLAVKTNSGMPETDDKGTAVFRSDNWDASWLGF